MNVLHISIPLQFISNKQQTQTLIKIKKHNYCMLQIQRPNYSKLIIFQNYFNLSNTSLVFHHDILGLFAGLQLVVSTKSWWSINNEK